MKRMVVLFASKYKQDVRAYLALHRVQYSMSVDIYTGVVRVSLPYAKGVRFISVLRCYSIPYELGC